jgi:hypothetical protein
MDNGNGPASSPPVKTMGGKTAALILLIVGLFAAVGGYFVIHNSQIPKSDITISGQVKSSEPAGQGLYDLEIDYTVQGKQYSFISKVPSQSATHDATYFVGDSVKVAYNPQNPGVGAKNASDKATPAYGAVIAVIGAIFAVIGFISLVQQLLTRSH